MIDSHPQSALLPQLRIGQSFGTKCGLCNLLHPACLHVRTPRVNELRMRVVGHDRADCDTASGLGPRIVMRLVEHQSAQTGLRRRERGVRKGFLACVVW